MYIIIICHWAILHYNMSFQTIAGRSDGVFWWFPALSEDQEKICRIHQNYLVALNGGQIERGCKQCDKNLLMIEGFFASSSITMWRWAPRGEGSRENHRGTVLEGCIHRLRCVISSPISQHQIVILTSSITQGKAVPANSLSTTLILSMFCQIHNFLLYYYYNFFFLQFCLFITAKAVPANSLSTTLILSMLCQIYHFCFFFFFFWVFLLPQGCPCRFFLLLSFSPHSVRFSPFVFVLALFSLYFWVFSLYSCKDALPLWSQDICWKECAFLSDNICESVFCYKWSETWL